MAAASLGAAAFVLLRFPPDRYGFYPACPLRAWTRLLCPGCGATHALAALLHGDLHTAWSANALFVALLPCALMYGMAVTANPKLRQALQTGFLSVVALAAAGFTLARNLS